MDGNVTFVCFLVIWQMHKSNACKSSNDIAMQEGKQASIKQQINRTKASNNFEIYYSNCTWKVDPAIKFIDGKVTHYFTVSSATNLITLDLSNRFNSR
jgi:hypothetical protein